jgi:PQQ-like domain
VTSVLTVIAVLAQLLFAGGLVLQHQPADARIAPHTSIPTVTKGTTGSWTTYHYDNAHTGYDPSLTALKSVSTGWTSPALSDTVYTEPLIYNGLVYAGAMDNTVYALRQFDGSVQWSLNLGVPQSGGWFCGNIDPTGILGTPVIDTSTNRIYVVAFLTSTHSYYLFGLDLQTGAIKLTTQIQPSGFDWRIQQQRGALALANGNVYVPFGGRVGDCGNYHGYVVAVPTSGAPVASYYVTPGIGAGFWAAGGVVVDDSTGKVFETSGNGTGSGCNSLGGSPPVPAFENDAVVRLSATLAHEDSFMPQDWQANWCSNDQDLGSATMVLISPTLAFQTGKWGQGFLVNPQALGGVNGQLYPSPVSYGGADVCMGNHNDANFGSYAYKAPYVYISCDGNGIIGLQINTGAPSFIACGACTAPNLHVPYGGTLGPPIVAGGAVWAVSTSGNGGLQAFNATTGASIFASTGFDAPRFSTPSAAGNQVFVSAGNHIRSFVMVPPVTSTASINYGTQAVSTASGPQTLTFTNGSAGTVNVSAVNVAGVNPSEWVKGTDTCTGQNILAAGICAVQYSFAPTDNGVRSATVTFVNNGPNNPVSALQGIGGTSRASNNLWFPWYDNSSPGVNADTIHITNPGGVLATGTIKLGTTTVNFNVGPGLDSYYTLPGGTIGGPVVINSTTAPVIASLRAWYYQSFNETPALSMADAATTLYLPWYDLQSPGVRADTIHITNPNAGTATGTIALPNVTPINISVGAGKDVYYTFPSGTIGGPVTITASVPVLATLRAWYYQSFNETAARPATAAAMTQYFPWYDLQSPGMRADTIHVTDVSGGPATGTIVLGTTTLNFSLVNGQDSYFTFPGGTIGGPVTITSSVQVLASLRAWYYQSFNEVPGRSGSPGSKIEYFPWYDHFSPGVIADTIHITNLTASSMSFEIDKVGDFPIFSAVPAFSDLYFAFPAQSIGGPVTIFTSAPAIISLRAWYYQTFNEVPAAF